MDTSPGSGPFTRAQLRAHGLNPARGLGKKYVQLVRNVWVRDDSVNSTTLLAAALLVHPDSAFASHLSAADVLGLPVPQHPFAHVTVHKHRDRRFHPRIKPHVTKRQRKVLVVGGVRVTDPLMTFIDCAGILGLVDLVILGDALVKKFKIKPKKLVAACERSTDYHARKALIAARLVRSGVDSPMETRLRLLLVLAGLPEPKVNIVIRDEHGNWVRRYDLGYPELKLIIEFDGRQHASDTEQWHEDITRREELDDQGYRILVVTYRGIYREPEQTLLRVHRQLKRAGKKGLPLSATTGASSSADRLGPTVGHRSRRVHNRAIEWI